MLNWLIQSALCPILAVDACSSIGCIHTLQPVLYILCTEANTALINVSVINLWKIQILYGKKTGYKIRNDSSEYRRKKQ